MFIIHTKAKKSKKRKPTAKQRQLASDWEKLLAKYEPKKKTNPVKEKPMVLGTTPVYRRSTEHIPSLGVVGDGDCTKKVPQQYTGTAIVGIATMHKSNAVPVFSVEDAKEISRMRRG